jgi:hypothetical protein
MPENVSNSLELFYKFSEHLVPHPDKAQILIEVDSGKNNLDKALSVLKNNETEPVSYEILRDGNPSWVLIYLPSEDMREAVFILTEAGFIKLVGIDPSVRKQDL